jgi:hypothetical protein
MAASVMPAASAVRTASAVGADTATMTGVPIAAVFCTISTETRLVSSTMPSAAGISASASAPASLLTPDYRHVSQHNAPVRCPDERALRANRCFQKMPGSSIATFSR